MQLKQIETLCKHSKIINILETYTHQWISDGFACYPLLKMPKLNEKTVLTVLNIPESKANKYTVTVQPMYEHFNINDDDLAEREINKAWMSIMNARPMKTSEGITFINDRYLKPLQDLEYPKFFERKTESGQIYIVIKDGLFINAIIMPTLMLNQDFVKDMRELAEQCEIAYILKEDKKNGQKNNSNDQDD